MPSHELAACDSWGARGGPTHTTSFEPLLHACWAAWCCWLLGCPCRAWCWLLGLATWVPVQSLHGAGYLSWLLGCLCGAWCWLRGAWCWLLGLATWVPVQGLVLATWVNCFGARGPGAGRAAPGAGYLGWLLGCPCGAWLGARAGPGAVGLARVGP